MTVIRTQPVITWIRNTPVSVTMALKVTAKPVKVCLTETSLGDGMLSTPNDEIQCHIFPVFLMKYYKEIFALYKGPPILTFIIFFFIFLR